MRVLTNTHTCIYMHIYIRIYTGYSFLYMHVWVTTAWEFLSFSIAVTPKNDYYMGAHTNADYYTLVILFSIYRIKYTFYEHYFLTTSFSGFRARAAKRLNSINLFGWSHE